MIVRVEEAWFCRVERNSSLKPDPVSYGLRPNGAKKRVSRRLEALATDIAAILVISDDESLAYNEECRSFAKASKLDGQ